MKNITLSNGITVRVKGISAILMDGVRNAVSVPQPPTYTAVTATGEVEHHTYNAADLEADAELNTEENRAALEKYKLDSLKAELDVRAQMMKLMFIKGLEVDYPTDETWVAEQTWLGMTVPTDPIERRYHYITTEVVTNLDEVSHLMEAIMAESGFSQEVMEQAESLFRHPVEEQATP